MARLKCPRGMKAVCVPIGLPENEPRSGIDPSGDNRIGIDPLGGLGAAPAPKWTSTLWHGNRQTDDLWNTVSENHDGAQRIEMTPAGRVVIRLVNPQPGGRGQAHAGNNELETLSRSRVEKLLNQPRYESPTGPAVAARHPQGHDNGYLIADLERALVAFDELEERGTPLDGLAGNTQLGASRFRAAALQEKLERRLPPVQQGSWPYEVRAMQEDMSVPAEEKWSVIGTVQLPVPYLLQLAPFDIKHPRSSKLVRRRTHDIADGLARISNDGLSHKLFEMVTKAYGRYELLGIDEYVSRSESGHYGMPFWEAVFDNRLDSRQRVIVEVLPPGHHVGDSTFRPFGNGRRMKPTKHSVATVPGFMNAGLVLATRDHPGSYVRPTALTDVKKVTEPDVLVAIDDALQRGLAGINDATGLPATMWSDGGKREDGHWVMEPTKGVARFALGTSGSFDLFFNDQLLKSYESYGELMEHLDKGGQFHTSDPGRFWGRTPSVQFHDMGTVMMWFDSLLESGQVSGKLSGYRKKTQVTSDIVIGQNDGRGNTAGGEMYRVRSKSNPNADYFTDEEDDAEGTAMDMAKGVNASPFGVQLMHVPFAIHRRPREPLIGGWSEERHRVNDIRSRHTEWRAYSEETPPLREGSVIEGGAHWTLMRGHPVLSMSVDLLLVGPNGTHEVRSLLLSAKALRGGELQPVARTNLDDRPFTETPFLLHKDSVGPALVALDAFLGTVGFSGTQKGQSGLSGAAKFPGLFIFGPDELEGFLGLMARSEAEGWKKTINRRPVPAPATIEIYNSTWLLLSCDGFDLPPNHYLNLHSDSLFITRADFARALHLQPATGGHMPEAWRVWTRPGGDAAGLVRPANERVRQELLIWNDWLLEQR